MADDNLSGVPGLVREMQEEDEQGGTLISKYVTCNQRETLDRTDAYVNSKHISGEKDSKGREKPFFNIVTAIRNIWYRATDIDRKNISLTSDKSANVIISFVMTILLHDWMNKHAFGKFLNKWGRSLATYGSTVLKFVEKDGELIPQVMPWSMMIVDPIDFDNNAKIEILWFTPAQLRAKKEYDQGMVEDLIETSQARKLIGGEDQDSKPGYIQLFELHGDLPLSNITDEEDDEDTYVQQMHVISFIAKKEGKGVEFDDFTLYRGREAKDPYMITHLIEEDGRTVSIGSVESLFEAQWMNNHSVKSIKDQLDLASKLIFQTSDGSFVGRNALSSIESGDIMIHKPNMPLTAVQNYSHDIASLQSYQQQWQTQGNTIAGASESMLGVAAKSGTAWRQTQAELQESHSLFELMTENKGLDIEEMMREFIIPHFKTKLNNSNEIGAMLDEHQITKLDAMFIPSEARKRAKGKMVDDILSKTPQDLANGNLMSAEDGEQMVTDEQQAIKKSMDMLGNQRFIKPSEISSKTWKEMVKDFEWQVDVDVTGENKDKEAILTTLNTVLQTIGNTINPQTGKSAVLEDPNMRMIFNKILETTGALSSAEINMADSAQPQAPQAPPQQEVQPVK